MSRRTGPLNVQRHTWSDASSAAHALAAAVADQLRQAIAQRAHALLAVSGGKSPVAFFEALRQQRLPWAQLTVLLVDERCVPPGHDHSNAALLRRHLLQGPAAAARFMPFFEALPTGAAEPPDDAAMDTLVRSAQARLHQLPWPLDVLVLGMGEDGHTASLFPGAPGLARALAGPQRVAGLRPLAAPHARLTLTLPVLQAARHVHLALAGAAKHAVFEQACQAAGPQLPVSLVLHRTGEPVQVWCSP